MSEGARKIRIEGTSMGQQVYLLEEGVAGTESVVESFLVPSNPHHHAMAAGAAEGDAGLLWALSKVFDGDEDKAHNMAGMIFTLIQEFREAP
jgi:hypothetical protein